MGIHRLNITDFPISILIKMVAGLLESVIHTNDAIPSFANNITIFHSRAVPNIKLEAYLARVQKYTPYNNEALLSILVYFDRISKLRPKFILNSLNIHRMLIASIVVASKFTSDIFYSNARYAKVGGIPLLELNKLEVEFLLLCDFNLHVRLEALQEYGDQLLHHSIPPTCVSEAAALNLNNKKRIRERSTSINSTEEATTPVPSPPVVHRYHHPSQPDTCHHRQHQHNTNNNVLLPLTPPMNDQEPDLKRRRQHHSPMLSLVSSENH